MKTIYTLHEVHADGGAMKIEVVEEDRSGFPLECGPAIRLTIDGHDFQISVWELRELLDEIESGKRPAVEEVVL